MKSKDYVLKHDYGYNREPELTDSELIKLKLRNFSDLKVYLEWTIMDIFYAKISKNNIIEFF